MLTVIVNMQLLFLLEREYSTIRFKVLLRYGSLIPGRPAFLTLHRFWPFLSVFIIKTILKLPETDTQMVMHDQDCITVEKAHDERSGSFVTVQKRKNNGINPIYLVVFRVCTYRRDSRSRLEIKRLTNLSRIINLII